MKKLGLCLAVTLGLSACATMDNGTATPNNPNTPNNSVKNYSIEAAMLNIYAKERSQKLLATVDGQNIVSDIKVTPKGKMQFNGKQVQGTEINTTTKSNNKLISQSVSTNYFTLNPLVFHGYTDSSGEYSVATQSTAIPKSAKVGDSNQLITENVYSDSSKSKQTGRYTQSWVLKQDSSNTAWFCIDSTANTMLEFDPKGTSAECYKINPKGDILASKLIIRQPSKNGSIHTMTFTSR